MDQETIAQAVQWIEQELLPSLKVTSESPDDPVIVRHVPKEWFLLGTGNYAAVLERGEQSPWIVKVYGKDRPGIEEEAEVYERLGEHPAYATCYYKGEGYLILKRLLGTNLYDCLLRGIQIPPSVISDVDEALAYARSRGLNPRDIHGKNILNDQGRGRVVDVSDFLLQGTDHVWRDTRQAYRWIYRPLLYRFPIRLPHKLLEGFRKVYRKFRKRSRHHLDA
ncbi:serine/threonine protein kinase [Paenibacillus sp. 1001270B_150601_E10]|uniref:serine/threonine protein kinase n=1 Tax=Paenibacillus sp. 1001270B_150601_E10 TaxID=2787079 RepID=UPI0018A0B3CF|nr:serine/threonine protein kinase [Paenibacillus sp. 1001270B_150601_E10]